MKVFQSMVAQNLLIIMCSNFFLITILTTNCHVLTLLQQNGRAERKHKQITETGLAMLFGANAPTTLWVDAFSSVVHSINCVPSSVLQDRSPF